jgi:predicted nucleic acid-binding protein
LKVYADTSLIMPLYLADTHSHEARRRMALRPLAFLTPFQQAEVANAIYQQVFRGQISLQGASLAYSDFERDCAASVWVLRDQPKGVFSTSIELARRRVASLGVRTLDTLHVASALELKVDAFWTFDQRQARLAEAEGLAIN